MNGYDGLYPAPPADLLALPSCAWPERDGDLEDPVAREKDLRGHLRAEGKTVLNQVECAQDLGAEHLVARRLVREPRTEEKIRQPREERGGEPRRQTDGRVRRNPARAVHDGYGGFVEEPQQGQEFTRIVLQIRVLDHDDVAADFRKPRADRRPLATLASVLQ